MTSTCGCGGMEAVTESSGCGCGCGVPAAKSREERIEELRDLRRRIDERLAELQQA